MRKNWIAVEDMDQEVGDVELLEVPAESLESDLVEVTGLDKDVEALVADGDELESDTDTIDALTDNVEASLEEDGMDETAARATDIAAEAFSIKWGIRRQTIGAEAFGNADSRRQATMIAAESLKDTAVNMWETFVKWIKEMIAKAKDLLLKLTNAGKSMKKRATKLEARIDSGLGTVDKKDVTGSFIKQIMIDEKVDYAGVLAYADAAPDAVTKLGATLATSIDEAGKVVRAGVVTDEAGKKSFVTTEFGKKTTKAISVPTGAVGAQIRAFPGNGFLTSYIGTNKIGQTVFTSAADKGNIKKVNTLTPKECTDGVKALFKIGETLETRLTGFRGANEKLEALVKAVEDAAKKLKDAKAEERVAARKTLALSRATVNASKAVERAATYSLTQAGQGIAGYVAASISAYKKA